MGRPPAGGHRPADRSLQEGERPAARRRGTRGPRRRLRRRDRPARRGRRAHRRRARGRGRPQGRGRRGRGSRRRGGRGGGAQAPPRPPRRPGPQHPGQEARDLRGDLRPRRRGLRPVAGPGDRRRRRLRRALGGPPPGRSDDRRRPDRHQARRRRRRRRRRRGLSVPRALERAFAFERAMHGAAGRTVTAAWGQAFLCPEIDRCYDRNLLWVVADGAGVDAATLDDHADRLLGGHGMTHRRLVTEPEADARLRDDLVARGFDAGSHLFLVHEGGAAPEIPAGIAVVEASIDELLAATDRYLRADPETEYGRDDLTREHLLAHHRDYGPRGSVERRFAVLDGDDVVAWARLWTRGAEAQVEDVVVLAEHRGRGYGRAVVAAATAAALADGADLLFIVADAEDWPKDLYGRLGYATAGALGVYLRYDVRAAAR